MAGLISLEEHEDTWGQDVITARIREDHIRRADEAAFAQLAKTCEGGVERRDGQHPMVEPMRRVLLSREDNLHLRLLLGNHLEFSCASADT